MRFILLFLFLIVSLLLGLSFGADSISLSDAFHHPESIAHQILWDVRLPRVLLGALVGISLASSGLAFQALLRNPLADPYILGVSGGAALGSVLAVGLHLAFFWTSLLAFLFALASMLLIYALARVKGRLNPHTLLLTGVLFNTLTFSLILVINALVSIEDLHRIWFLMVGSVEAIEYSRLAIAATFILIGFSVLFYDASAMNLLTLGGESAQLMGVNGEALRRRVFFAASLMIGATVSISGLVGFVGLAVPHMARLLFGSDHRNLLPASAMGGASFVILADLVARKAFAGATLQTQIPVGVVTALIGAPLFFYLLKKNA